MLDYEPPSGPSSSETISPEPDVHARLADRQRQIAHSEINIGEMQTTRADLHQDLETLTAATTTQSNHDELVKLKKEGNLLNIRINSNNQSLSEEISDAMVQYALHHQETASLLESAPEAPHMLPVTDHISSLRQSITAAQKKLESARDRYKLHVSNAPVHPADQEQTTNLEIDTKMSELEISRLQYQIDLEYQKLTTEPDDVNRAGLALDLLKIERLKLSDSKDDLVEQANKLAQNGQANPSDYQQLDQQIATLDRQIRQVSDHIHDTRDLLHSLQPQPITLATHRGGLPRRKVEHDDPRRFDPLYQSVFEGVAHDMQEVNGDSTKSKEPQPA